MLFSVIYSVDVPSDEDVLDHAPPKADELWDQTEGDEQYEYDYLEGGCDEGHHRKWAGLLTSGVRLYRRATPRDTTLARTSTNWLQRRCIPAHFSFSTRQCGHGDAVASSC